MKNPLCAVQSGVGDFICRYSPEAFFFCDSWGAKVYAQLSMGRCLLFPFHVSPRSCVSALCVLFYMILIFSNFTNNEFEEQFNGGVLSADDYVDFDGDGEFDLDQEDDEEGRSKVSKSALGDWILVVFSYNFGSKKGKYSSSLAIGAPQFIPSDIFHPPRA